MGQHELLDYYDFLDSLRSDFVLGFPHGEWTTSPCGPEVVPCVLLLTDLGCPKLFAAYSYFGVLMEIHRVG